MLAFDSGDLKKASNYAHELLDTAPQFKKDWDYGNAIHHGNCVLGRVALQQGDTKTAIHYLLESGKTKGSPQLDSFGPNMCLARELLVKGEKDAVLQYFGLCRNFWESGGDQLDEWTRQVKAGETPDFGANLRY